MSDTLYPDVVVQLSGQDPNAFAIMARVKEALRRHFRETESKEWAQIAPIWDKYLAEATAGNYNELLQTTMKWVSVR